MNAVLSHVMLLTPGIITTTFVGVALIVLTLWAARTRHAQAAVQLVVLLLAVGVGLGSWWYVDHVWQPVADGIGTFVWTWVGLLALVVLMAVVGPWRGGHLLRRSLGGVLSVASTLLLALLSVNAWFSTYPTLASALGTDVSTSTLTRADAPQRHPDTITGPLLNSWRPPAGMPRTGSVVQVTIPASGGGFTPRPAEVYLPPAYRTAHRPLLPVLLLMAGVPGSPQDWTGPGDLQQTMDAFAAAHRGLAPVVVVPDPLGATLANPLCSDTAHGAVATYLQRDVPAWVTSHLQVDTRHAHWAIGGISNGATCAWQVVTRAPQIFPTFLSMSGELHPTLGNPSRTLAQGYGGNAAEMAANDPLTLMTRHRYPQVAGIVSVGSTDQRYGPAAHQLEAAGRQAGMDLQLRTYHGGHAWTLWAQQALPDELPWLAQRLGITA